MRYKPFAATGVQLPVIGQGTWDVPEHGARLDEWQRALKRGIELGMTHIDTAEMYGSGSVEELLGEAIRGIPRDSFFITGKVLPSNASFDGTIRACDRTLKRLRIDHLDAYLLHWPSGVPLEETMNALASLVRTGKTRFVGVSNFDVEDMLEAKALLGSVPLACNQVLYHLHERGIEHRLVPAAREADVAVVAYTPFGRGRFPRAANVGDVLERIATKHAATARQVILAFLTRESNVFTIPKASHVKHVEENAGAGDLILDDTDVASIDAAFPVGRERPLATL
ncbi:MAG: aldo/keto reductase [Candidatus Baltobacteraceae bacterium]